MTRQVISVTADRTLVRDRSRERTNFKRDFAL